MTPANHTPQDALLHFAEIHRARENSKNASRRLGALLLAAAIHFVLLTQWVSPPRPEHPMPRLISLLEVELVASAVAHEAVKAVEPPIEKTVVPENKPEPLQQMPDVTEKETPPAATPSRPVRPVAKKIRPAPHRVKTTPQPAQARPTTVAKPAPSQPHPSRAETVARQQQLQSIRRNYLAAIMAAIEAEKKYPYSARRRHIEGDISISLQVDRHGRISAIEIHGNASVLRTASMQAIQAAGRMPTLPAQLTAPLHTRFTMQYRLRQ